MLVAGLLHRGGQVLEQVPAISNFQGIRGGLLDLKDSVGRCDGSPEMTFGCGGHCSLSGLFPGGEGEIMSMRPLPAP
ncbi:hypothetical protein, partial [Streptomyces sp. NEAU-YJ-81]|uniref:hypothetical protein n=1 Tax=Streptomyces sp. NEAU-YJ-81 TaxID=2820288 RepID=UPI001ABCD29C